MIRLACSLMLASCVIALISLPQSQAQWIQHSIDGGSIWGATYEFGDLDGNGFLDVAFWTTSPSNGIGVMLLGEGGVVQDQLTLYGPYYMDVCRAIEIADVDGDGQNDILTAYLGPYADETDSDIIYFHNGDWDWHYVLDAADALYMIADDFDQDGDPDVISPLYGFGLSALENLSGTYADPVYMPNGPSLNGSTWETADLNLDGYPDIVGTSWDDEPVLTVFLNVTANGSGRLFTEIPIVGQSNVDIISVHDVDDDADADVLVRQADAFSWVENTGTPTWIDHPVTVPIGLENRFTGADFNRDGVGDLALGRYLEWNEGSYGVWTSEDSGFVYEELGSTVFLECFRAIDLNRDGRTDLFVSGLSSIHWYENVFPPQQVLHLTPVPDVEPYYILPGGGTITMTVTVSWPFDLPPGAAVFEVSAILPSGDQTGPLVQYSFAVEPGEEYELNNVQLTMPATAPPGEYEIDGQVTAGQDVFTDSFTVVKLGQPTEAENPGSGSPTEGKSPPGNSPVRAVLW